MWPGLLFVGLLCCVGCASSQSRRAAPEGRSATWNDPVLKAELLPPSADPVAGERITLKLKITNVSPEPVDLPWPRFIDQFITSVQRASDGTVTRVAHTGLALGHGKYPGGLLQPSESMSVDLTHVFDAPGVHRVKCELRTTREACPWWSFWEGCVDTEELRVAVRGKGADNE